MYQPPPAAQVNLMLNERDEPEVTEEVALEGKLLWMLKRIMGRLTRAERSGDSGRQLRFFQSKASILSCLANVMDSQVEKVHMNQQL